MKLRKEKEQIPADFRKQMYENYKANMTYTVNQFSRTSNG